MNGAEQSSHSDQEGDATVDLLTEDSGPGGAYYATCASCGHKSYKRVVERRLGPRGGMCPKRNGLPHAVVPCQGPDCEAHDAMGEPPETCVFCGLYWGYVTW